MPAPIIETSRVLLRHWGDEDLEPWIVMNADPETMLFFPRTSAAEESTASFQRLKNNLQANDFGLWAAEEKLSGEFMGFVGISWQGIPTLSEPKCQEIGWRLAKRYWGNGYATEAATEVLNYASKTLKLTELYSITSELNLPSINVMKKIGLQPRPELSFLHPRVPEGSPLRPHVVYSL